MTAPPYLVVIGASWGGLHALGRVLGPLPGTLPAAIAVAQHRGSGDPEMLGDLLARRTALAIGEARDGARLEPGRVYLAPAGRHLLVDPRALALSTTAPVHFSRPSLDVLFDSAAEAFGEHAVGVVLTGANADGAAGLAHIAARGGRTCVQDPEEAERPEMPRAALAAVTPDAVLRLDAIGPWIASAVAS